MYFTPVDGIHFQTLIQQDTASQLQKKKKNTESSAGEDLEQQKYSFLLWEFGWKGSVVVNHESYCIFSVQASNHAPWLKAP